MQSNFDDVVAFQRKFGIPMPESPQHLPPDVLRFRIQFLIEELNETIEAANSGDIVKFFDGLLDLAYVAKGTAAMAGLPWQEGWAEVHHSNMQKQRVERAGMSERGHAFDVVKPEGWQPPRLEEIIKFACGVGYRCGSLWMNKLSHQCQRHHGHVGKCRNELLEWDAAAPGLQVEKGES